MDIILYNNKSPDNYINKNLTQVAKISGNFRNVSDVVTPTIVCEGALPTKANYAYISEFNRYHYIRDIRTIRNNVYELSLKSDVLMSFNINSVSGVIVETEVKSANLYIESRAYVETVKDKTDIKVFPNGLLETGEYILITAGGG